MADEEAKPTIGQSNIEHVKKEIRKSIPGVRKDDEARKAANDSRNAKRQHLQELGIPKAAFDMALRYLNWDADKQQGFDTAYQLVREVGGKPVRHDLFDYADREERRAAAVRLLELKGTMDSAADRKVIDLAVKALGGFADDVAAANGEDAVSSIKEAAAKSDDAVKKAAAKKAADRAEATSAKKK